MSFCVVTLTNLDVDTLKRFTAYYFDQGADRIALYFDDPKDPAIEFFKEVPKVDVIPCDAQFRENLAFPKEKDSPPQLSISSHAYENLTEDWVVRVDMDEFMYFPGRKISDLLAKVQDEVQTFRPKVAEALSIDAPQKNNYIFRRQMEEKQIEEIYGDLSGAMMQGRGMISHIASKSITRRGLDGIVMREHGPKIRKPGLRLNVGSTEKPWEDGYLLHFNSDRKEDWLRKLRWRLLNGSIRLSTGAYLFEYLFDPKNADTTIDDLTDELHKKIFFFDSQRLEKLKKMDLLLEIEIDFDALVEKYYP